jgi:hypothetical protein
MDAALVLLDTEVRDRERGDQVGEHREPTGD